MSSEIVAEHCANLSLFFLFQYGMYVLKFWDVNEYDCYCWTAVGR